MVGRHHREIGITKEIDMFYMIMIMPRLEKKPVPKPEPMLKPYSSLRLGSMRVESVPVLKPSQFPYAPPHAARQ